MQDLVSVIITTKNEEKNLENCIRSIQAQSYGNIELIVVDNFSDDATKEIALRLNAKYFTKGPERSAQRNYGMAEKSSGKYVMYIDADMILSPDLVEESVKYMDMNAASALYIPEIVLGKQFFSKVRRFERSFYDGTPVDGVRFFLKEAFVQVKGFDETMSGPEDWDIDKKIKSIGKAALVKLSGNSPVKDWAMHNFILDRGVDPLKYRAVIYHNESEFDLKKYISKKAYYAQSFEGYIQKWGRNDPDIKKQFGLGYRYFGVFIEKGKWLKLLLHPVLTLGMYFLRFLVGSVYLLNKSKSKSAQ